MKLLRKPIIIGLIVFLLYIILTWPPCRIIKSDYLHSDMLNLPNVGAVVHAAQELPSMLYSYGIKDIPAWLNIVKLASDEMIVLYPNARITGTAPLHEYLFIVKCADVPENSKPGVGVALLKGNTKKRGVKFN